MYLGNFSTPNQINPFFSFPSSFNISTYYLIVSCMHENPVEYLRKHFTGFFLDIVLRTADKSAFKCTNRKISHRILTPHR